MPFVDDLSPNFSIFVDVPETKSFTHSDSISVSESFSKSVQTWKTVLSVSTSLSLIDSGLSRTVTDFRSNYTNSDSLTLTDSGLSRTTDTWRYIFSVSAGLGLTDSGLTRATSTWRYLVTPSDSLGLTDSGLSKAIETWRHVINYNMSLTVSESLSRATPEWRKQLTKSDAISIADGLDVDVETIIHIRDLSDSLSVAESLGRATQLWYNPFTASDSLSISDGLSVQVKITDDVYFYDNIGLKDATILRGSISGGNFTSNNALIVNESSLTDGHVGLSTTFKSTSGTSCVVFDLGSAKETTFVAIYLNTILNGNINFYGSNSQGSGYSNIGFSNSSSTGWAINIVDDTYRYYAVQCESLSADVQIAEIIIGKQFKPEVRFDVGSQKSKRNDNVSIAESLGGTEYAFKTKDDETRVVRNYSNISSGLKSEFESLSNNGNVNKFIYSYDGLTYGLIEPMQFEEIAHNRYRTSVSIS